LFNPDVEIGGDFFEPCAGGVISPIALSSACTVILALKSNSRIAFYASSIIFLDYCGITSIRKFLIKSSSPKVPSILVSVVFGCGLDFELNAKLFSSLTASIMLALKLLKSLKS
jgi:hypothetical protein